MGDRIPPAARDQAAEQYAYYLDGEGDVWTGNKDGTVSLMEKVADDDRYARRGFAEIERMTTRMTRIGSADDNAK